MYLIIFSTVVLLFSIGWFIWYVIKNTNNNLFKFVLVFFALWCAGLLISSSSKEFLKTTSSKRQEVYQIEPARTTTQSETPNLTAKNESEIFLGTYNIKSKNVTVNVSPEKDYMSSDEVKNYFLNEKHNFFYNYIIEWSESSSLIYRYNTSEKKTFEEYFTKLSIDKEIVFDKNGSEIITAPLTTGTSYILKGTINKPIYNTSVSVNGSYELLGNGVNFEVTYNPDEKTFEITNWEVVDVVMDSDEFNGSANNIYNPSDEKVNVNIHLDEKLESLSKNEIKEKALVAKAEYISKSFIISDREFTTIKTETTEDSQLTLKEYLDNYKKAALVNKFGKVELYNYNTKNIKVSLIVEGTDYPVALDFTYEVK